MKEGTCERCRKDGLVSAHHPYPQRHYGKTNEGNAWTFDLCKRCHKHADKLTFEIDRRVSQQIKPLFHEAFMEFMRSPAKIRDKPGRGGRRRIHLRLNRRAG